jgi:DHA3 family tetracycline resistance protein-like MFS transporter
MEARAARVWLAYQAATWFAFQTSTTATMVFLITRLHLNALELTLVGTVLEITVTLCEIPTGVVADTVSRKVSIVIGVALLGFGFLLFAVPSYPVVLLAQVVWAVGYTFTSGADVAWITDEVGEEAARPLYVRGAQARQAAIFAGIVTGAALGAIALWLAIVVGAVLQLINAVWLWFVMPETAFVRADPALRPSAATTMKRTVTDAVGTVRTHPTLLVTLGLTALMGLAAEGFDRLLDLHILTDIGIPDVGNLAPVVWIGALHAGGLLCAVALTEVVRRRADLDSDRGIERTAEIVVLGLVVTMVAFGLSRSFWVAAITLWAAAAVWEVSEPVLDAWVNRGLDSRTRATVNSLASQAHALGEVAGGPTFGGIAVLTSTPLAAVGQWCTSPIRCPRMLLLLSERAFGRYADRIDAAVPDVRFIRMQTDGELVLEEQSIEWDAAAPDVAWLTSDLFDGGPVRKFLRLSLNCKPQWLQTSGAGTDHPVFQMLLDGGTRLTTSHVTGIPIAEYIVRAVLDHFQQVRAWTDVRKAKQWRPHDFREVHGTTWLIVGLGHIGTEVAVRAKAFGAHVIGIRRSPTGREPVDECCRPDELDALLPRADVVVLTAPGGTATRHLIDRARLALFRPDSILVNVGRGSLVDESALRRALDRGAPEAAILDVTEEEPLPEGSWLWSHPRVELTPHSSAGGTGRYERAAQAFIENLVRWEKGEPLVYEVTAGES